MDVSSEAHTSCTMRTGKTWGELLHSSCHGYVGLNFTTDGFVALHKDGRQVSYKRIGEAMVGVWNIKYSSGSQHQHAYTILRTLQVLVGRMNGPILPLLPSTDLSFPAAQGWYRLRRSRNRLEYLRSVGPFQLEVQTFCVQSHAASRHCGVAVGEKERWSLQERNVCFASKGKVFFF